jgi:hypothetical protein
MEGVEGAVGVVDDEDPPARSASGWVAGLYLTKAIGFIVIPTDLRMITWP